MRRFPVFALWLLTCVPVMLFPSACVNTSPMPETERSASQYTLAVLPWNMSAHRYNESLAYGTTALRLALRRSVFRLVFSFYELPAYPATRLQQSDGRDVGALWGHRSPRSDPDFAAAFQLGEALGVDAVLTYALEPRSGPDYIGVYLLDIPQRKKYAHYNETVVYYERDGEREIFTMTKRVFAEFTRHRKRTRPS